MMATADEVQPSVVNAKKKKGKKRKISKHIAEASNASKETKPQKEELPTNSTEAFSSASRSKKKNKKAHVKDPAEAAAYLTSWRKTKNNGGDGADAWKFNKNTQSWLIRHMYDFDKVSKSTFGDLLDYLQKGDGKTIARIREDATRRALRYQAYGSTKEESESAAKPREDTKDNNNEDEDDNARWNNLNDHDKRKEYKRARKVLDALSSSF